MHNHIRVPGSRARSRAIRPAAIQSVIPAVIMILAMLASLRSAQAGVANPDISAIGQVVGGYAEEPGSPDSGQAALRSGEMEMVLEAYLNPFIKGWFTLSGGEGGFALEEGYASMVKGLPWGLNLKAGKYRMGFGKLNPTHPHAYPFITAPRSLASLLPGGEEGFNETGLQVSDLLPTPGDWASALSADLIEARQFHPDREFTRLGWLGRWTNDFLIGEVGAVETGLSAASGKVVAPEWESAYLYGADVKAKFYLPGASQLTLQAEGVYRRFQKLSGPEPEAEILADHRSGFVAFADYRYHTQWNGGLLFERWEAGPGMDGAGTSATSGKDMALRVFAGYAVLEESTLIRLMYERFLPDGAAAADAVSLQLLFSMGPHKAHQF